MPAHRVRRRGFVTRLAVAVLCAIGIGISAAAGPGDLVLGAKHAAVEFETVRISKPDGSVVTLRVPRGRPLTLLGSGGGTVLRAQTPETERELGLRDPHPAAGAQAGARPDLTPGGGRVSLRAPTGRVDSRVRLSHPYLGTRTIEADLGAMTRGATAAAGPDRRSLDDLRDPVVAGDGMAERRAGRGWRPDGDSGKDGGYVLDEFIVLEPGDGWDGPTQEPPPVGEPTDRGYDAKAIARWDVVPYQTITDDFTIGVVAFHMNGIEQVLFSVDKGPWAPVKKMQLNPRTNVWEYCVTLRPSLFRKDGLVEVRAVAVPKGAGLPRLLAGPIENSLEFRRGNHSMVLSVNAHGTLPEPQAWADAVNGSDETGQVGNPGRPFRTPFRALHKISEEYGSADGATVYLQPGDYTWGREEYMTSPKTWHRWATITAAKGIEKGRVRFVASKDGGFLTHLVRIRSASFPSAIQLFAAGSNNVLWLDDCTFRSGGSFWNGSWYWGIYVTDTLFERVGHAVVSASLARSVVINGIDNDAFPAGLALFNCKVLKQNAEGTDHHADIWQPRPDYVENIILYGLVAPDAKEQGLFTRGNNHRDVAIVNCAISLFGYPDQNQFCAEFDHLLVSYNTFIGSPFHIGLSDSSYDYGYYGSRNAIWSRNVFQWMSLSDPQSFSGSSNPDESDLPGTTFLSNHFFDVWPDYHNNGGDPIGRPYGDDATEGPVAPPDRGAYGAGTPPWVQDQPR